jgi:hypothetical protein
MMMSFFFGFFLYFSLAPQRREKLLLELPISVSFSSGDFFFLIEGEQLPGDSRFLFSSPAHGALAEILLHRLLAEVGLLLGDRYVFLICVPFICECHTDSQKSLP